MNTNDINFLIEKACDKLGIAFNTTQPIAEDIIRQYSTAHYALAGICLFVTLALCFLVYRCVKKINEYEMVQTLGAVFGALFAMGTFTAFAYNLYCAIAPIPAILGM